MSKQARPGPWLIDSVFEAARPRISLDPANGHELLACLTTHCPRRPRDGSWLMHAATGQAPSVGRQRRGGTREPCPCSTVIGWPSEEDTGGAPGGCAATPRHTIWLSSCFVTRTTTALALLWRRPAGAGLRPLRLPAGRTPIPSTARSPEQLLSLPESCLLYSRPRPTPAEGVHLGAEERPSTPASVARPTNAIFRRLQWRRMKLAPPPPHSPSPCPAILAFPANPAEDSKAGGCLPGRGVQAPVMPACPSSAGLGFASHRARRLVVDVRCGRGIRCGPDGRIAGKPADPPCPNWMARDR